MDAIVAAAKDEEQRLLSLLSQNPIYVKLRAVRNLLKAYEMSSASTDRLVAVGTRNIVVTAPVHAQATASRNVASQVRAWIIPYLKERNQRVQSNELLDLALEQGIAIGGNKPVATLSSYLSGMPELNNVRGQGYGLAEWSERDDSLRSNGLAEMAGINPDTEDLVSEELADVDVVPPPRVRVRMQSPSDVDDLIESRSEQNTETAEKVSGQEPSAASGSRLFGDEEVDPLS